jgi:N-formylglutamate amidohydrolase
VRHREEGSEANVDGYEKAPVTTEPIQIARKVILHIPHTSTVIPTDLREQFLLSDADLFKELLLMTDAFTDELFRADEVGGTVVQFPG